jgi:hypothetical protein
MRKANDRSSYCHLRSECKAESNRRYYDRLLKDDFDMMVINRDSKTGEYAMNKAKVK